MASRLTLPGTVVALSQATAAEYNALPGGWIGYNQVTSDQGSITSLADLSGLAVTVTLNASRRIRIVGDVQMGNSSNGAGATLYIRESSTVLQTRNKLNSSDIIVEGMRVEIILDAPSAGSHTYKLSMEALAAGTKTFALGVSHHVILALMPAGVLQNHWF